MIFKSKIKYNILFLFLFFIIKVLDIQLKPYPVTYTLSLIKYATRPNLSVIIIRYL